MKITRATIKSFIKKNENKLYIKVESSFDGMTDCVQSTGNDFSPVVYNLDSRLDNTLGINGAWFVGESRDLFHAFENETYVGYEIYNCCGSFYLAIKK